MNNSPVHMQGATRDMPPPYSSPSGPAEFSQLQQPLPYGNPPQSIQQSSSQSSVVVVQQPPQIYQQMTTPPSDYLGWSICGCLCCLWPIGICAIVASMNARSAVDRGDLEDAKTNSNVALGINITNTVIGIIFFVVIVVVVLS
ncbi:tumor suppressor candidate 5 homolog [Mizuhopecten yessoensis]|uniref:tumor suppressor candidate 5 homolog n=1 Tax=Mizuhopecten yessoensis TaxID=6573 RepID=UPI000B4577B9|nr:tumor suppressor candidate 5 homolog [Mizuhopecten yessoensis]XP_021379302.1 tumor suppressor candidate 5 homolog [Mizuhopecten yessoensis]